MIELDVSWVMEVQFELNQMDYSIWLEDALSLIVSHEKYLLSWSECEIKSNSKKRNIWQGGRHFQKSTLNREALWARSCGDRHRRPRCFHRTVTGREYRRKQTTFVVTLEFGRLGYVVILSAWKRHQSDRQIFLGEFLFLVDGSETYFKKPYSWLANKWEGGTSIR